MYLFFGAPYIPMSKDRGFTALFDKVVLGSFYKYDKKKLSVTINYPVYSKNINMSHIVIRFHNKKLFESFVGKFEGPLKHKQPIVLCGIFVSSNNDNILAECDIIKIRKQLYLPKN